MGMHGLAVLKCLVVQGNNQQVIQQGFSSHAVAKTLQEEIKNRSSTSPFLANHGHYHFHVFHCCSC